MHNSKLFKSTVVLGETGQCFPTGAAAPWWAEDGRTACCHLVPCSDICSGFPGSSNCHPGSPAPRERPFSAKGWLCTSSWLLLGLPTVWPCLFSQDTRGCCPARLPASSDLSPPSGRFREAWSLRRQGRATRAWPPGHFLLLFWAVPRATHGHWNLTPTPQPSSRAPASCCPLPPFPACSICGTPPSPCTSLRFCGNHDCPAPLFG